MSGVQWNGPWSETPMALTGWSNFVSSANDDIKARWRDGDPINSAFAWEVAGNLNHKYSQDRRIIWSDCFIEPSGADGLGAVISGSVLDWENTGSIFTMIGPMFVIPNVRRGGLNPPEFKVKIRARTNTANHTGSVRVYTFASPNEIMNWTKKTPPSKSFWTTAISNSSYDIDATCWTHAGTISQSQVAWNSINHPEYADTAKSFSYPLMVTYFCVATLSSGSGSTKVAAIQITEEQPISASNVSSSQGIIVIPTDG